MKRAWDDNDDDEDSEDDEDYDEEHGHRRRRDAYGGSDDGSDDDSDDSGDDDGDIDRNFGRGRHDAEEPEIEDANLAADAYVQDVENQENDEGDENDDEDAVYVTLDFGDTPVLNTAGTAIAATTFSVVGNRLFEHQDYLSSEEGSLIHLQLVNHYDLVNIAQLTEFFNDANTIGAIGDRLNGLTFVSCGLYADGLTAITAFAQSLSQYKSFRKFTLDLTDIHTDLVRIAGGADQPEDRPRGQLAAALVTAVPNLECLYLSGFGNEAIELLCDPLLHNGDDGGATGGAAARNALKRLEITNATFDTYGFECLSNVLTSNMILQELSLPDHATINDECAIALAPGIALNSTLTSLDLHVTELGHEGVQELGIEALLQGMEDNPACILSKLDVSADDGSPQVPRDLQTRLTACLVRNSSRNNNKYMKYARMAVDIRHSDD